jgi:hypothetical protein
MVTKDYRKGVYEWGGAKLSRDLCGTELSFQSLKRKEAASRPNSKPRSVKKFRLLPLRQEQKSGELVAQASAAAAKSSMQRSSSMILQADRMPNSGIPGVIESAKN